MGREFLDSLDEDRDEVGICHLEVFRIISIDYIVEREAKGLFDSKNILCQETDAVN